MKQNRRNFIKSASLASLGLLTNAASANAEKTENKNPFPKTKDKLNVGFMGVGLRGRDHLEQILDREDCNVVAINDNDPNSILEAQKLVDSKKKKQIGRASCRERV